MRGRGDGGGTARGDRLTAPDLAAAAAVLSATAVAFAPVLGNGFVNWDDPEAIAENAALTAPGLLSWAFSTTHMSHYQPLAWLAWAAVRRLMGPGAGAFHLASLACHLANTALVFLLGARLGSLCGVRGAPRRVASLAAAVCFGLHPLRVEAVAWASAFPYVLALTPLLPSSLAALDVVRSGARRWLLASLVFFALSLLVRPAALGFPIVLLLLDWLAGRLASPSGRRAALAEKVPFAVLAGGAAIVEAGARPFLSLDRFGLGPRLYAAGTAPFAYLAETVLPVRLNPLDPLPLEPQVAWPLLAASMALLVVVTLTAFRTRASLPGLLAGWLAYLALLAPAAGLAPSGMQASADRYTYFPAVALSLAAGGGFAWLASRRGQAMALATIAALALALAVSTDGQARVWRDSRTLWTRAVALDPRNDVALYNLATALAAEGDVDGAAAGYRQLLEIIPGHVPARQNLSILEARRLESEAGAAAAAGRLEEAVAAYARTLELDPARLHARASRGMALAQLGRPVEALPDLQAALEAGRDEPELFGALAFCLAQAGRRAEARQVLEAGLARHPKDAGLARSLAELGR